MSEGRDLFSAFLDVIPIMTYIYTILNFTLGVNKVVQRQ